MYDSHNGKVFNPTKCLGNLPQEDGCVFPKQRLEDFGSSMGWGEKNGFEVLSRFFSFLAKDIEASLMLRQYLACKGFLVNAIGLAHDRYSGNIY